jgi:DNA-binding transcriptional ArsR family regulator
MKRNAAMSAVWGEIEKLRLGLGFPERCDLALMDAAFGYKVRNQRYREDQDISDVAASRDLKKLTDLGLLEAVGEKRGRHYVSGPYEILKAKVGQNQLALRL